MEKHKKTMEEMLDQALELQKRGFERSQILNAFPKECHEELEELLSTALTLSQAAETLKPERLNLLSIITKNQPKRLTAIFRTVSLNWKIMLPLGTVAGATVIILITVFTPQSPSLPGLQNLPEIKNQESSFQSLASFNLEEIQAEAQSIPLGQDFEDFFAAEESLKDADAILNF